MGKTVGFKYNLTQYLIGLAIILALGVILSIKNFRWDLTEDQRYTLSENTIAYFDAIPDNITIEIYLSGKDLPYNYQLLSNAVKDLVKDVKNQSNANVNFSFIDPYQEFPDDKEREKLFIKLTEDGLRYSQEEYEEDGVRKNTVYFPGALIYWNGKTEPWQFIKGQMFAGANSDAVAFAINNLEYELMSAVKKLTQKVPYEIGFATGHGELTGGYIYDLKSHLSQYYNVSDFNLTNDVTLVQEIKNLDLLLIPNPDSAFSKQEQFILDQFVMKGGKVIWMLEGTNILLDSLKTQGFTWGMVKDLGLNEQLYKYGFRVNNDIILDNQCLPIQLPAGEVNGNVQYRTLPWYYMPIFKTNSNSIVGKGVNPVPLQYASSVEFVGDTSEMKVEVLLASSTQALKRNAPVRIATNIASSNPGFPTDPRAKTKAVALMVEGKFKSAFNHRSMPGLEQIEGVVMKEESRESKMMVIGDGDIAKNQFFPESGQGRPLGFDMRARKVVWGNLDFMMNAVEYMLGDETLQELRGRNIIIRPLQNDEIKYQKSFWLQINLGVPVALIILFGTVYLYWRKRKFAK